MSKFRKSEICRKSILKIIDTFRKLIFADINFYKIWITDWWKSRGFKNRGSRKWIYFRNLKSRIVKNFKQVPQIMASYSKTNIASEKIINYKVTSPSNHCCQISVIVGEKPEISIIIHSFLFLRQERNHINIFLHWNLCISTT